MLHQQNILCFANDWDSDPLSKKHVMSRLARTNRVLWVDSLGIRNPTVSGRDLRRVAAKVAAFGRGCRRVQDDLWVLSPLVVPFHGSAAARRFNRLWLRRTLRRALRRLNMENPITWTFLPSSAGVVGRLGEQLVVYHCVDEYSEFSGTDAGAIRTMEAELVTRSDVVLVSGERLLEDKRKLDPATRLVTHGVEVEHFRQALDPGLRSPAPEGSSGPVVGFFGLVADWVDLDLVAFLARARPEWTFLLIGKVDTDVTAIEGLANVRLVGPLPYADLPAWCRGFDAAILPFRINELTLNSNPLKLREYLAAGLPVVASALPEAERLSPLVRIGRDSDHFLELLDDILVVEGSRGPRAEISRAMDGESWDSKVEEMCDIVEAALRERSAEPARAAGAGGS